MSTSPNDSEHTGDHDNVVQQQQPPPPPLPPKQQFINSFDIEYILFSEFDIDKGSVVRIQYPKLFPYCSESELSAQMLPDGSHNCTEDATVFIVRAHSTPVSSPQSDDSTTSQSENMASTDRNVTGDVYYGLNVYKQKKYENIRRGARVKSIAVISRQKTCFSLKPLLNEALEAIFQMFDHEKNSYVSEMKAHASDQDIYDKITQHLHDFISYIFQHINSIDLSHIPIYSDIQKVVWRFCIRKNVPLYENVETIFVYNKENRFSTAAKRIFLRIPTLLLDNEISILYEKKEKVLGTEELSALHAQLLAPHARIKKHHRRNSSNNSNQSTNRLHDDNLKKKKEKHNGTKTSLVNLIQVFGEKIMIIFNAILYGKNIMFIANNRNAGSVIQYVLAALLLHPQLPNLLRQRVFPYVSFMNMDWLNEKDNGFIAGVTNPIFASRDEYFDFLCDIDTGKIIVSTFEKNRLQQKQHLATPKKKQTKLKSTKKTKHKKVSSSSSEDFSSSSIDIDPAILGSSSENNEEQTKSQQEDTNSKPLDSSPDITNIGSGMGFFSEYLTGALSLNSGTAIIQSATVQVAENDDVYHMTTKDTEFIRKILHLISQNQKKNVPREETEEIVRGYFYDYSTSVLELAFDMRQRILYQKRQYYRSVSSSYDKKAVDEEEPDENVLKAFAWMQTNSFKLYAERRAEYSKTRLILNLAIDIPASINTLVNGSNLEEETIITIFHKFLRNIHSREELLEFTSYMPDCRGGISPIAYPIFHKSPAVRVAVAAFLRRLEKEGLLLHLNPFLMINYVKNVKLLSECEL